LWLHAVLFGLTVLTTTYIGIFHYLGFESQFGAVPLAEMTEFHMVRTFWLQGLWYSGTILLILGAHELGHYFACRYYDIDASPPYFIPVPPPVLTGTLGAFIKIRQPFPNRRVLFDVGVAGPLAGFVFAVPALLLGLALSNVAFVPPDMVGEELGEPLIFKAATWLIWGAIPSGHSVNLHPMAFAAWFGLLATMLNLFPIGQLDGGHIAYTALGRRSAVLTRVMVGVIIALVFVSISWLLWAVLLVVMLFAFGVHHPPTLDDTIPLGRARQILVVVALVIFILCFIPAPIQPLDLVR
jgi:membrane-associated protease RseP (regulator of RpoE activity)